MRNGYEELLAVLKKDDRFTDENGSLLKNKIQECALKTDEKLLKLLLENESTKNQFFVNIDGIMVFDKNRLSQVVESRQFLPDSYTKFSQNIVLADEYGNPIKQSNDVVLQFPNKDCVLEFDSTDENENRDEVFLNETLMKNEIDSLLSPKVFHNAALHDVNKDRKAIEITLDDNLIIKGNNLIAMHSLLPKYIGKIKLMYWDILYNTNNDHVPYNDSFKHSSWLTMMKNRLEIAKKLLKKEGTILIQCDSTEMAYLKVLMDEVFERQNFISMITCKVKTPSGVSSGMQAIFDSSEYILCYAKDIKQNEYNRVKVFTEIVSSESKTVKNYKYTLKNVQYDKKEFIEEKDGIKYYRIPKGNFDVANLDIKNMKIEDFYNEKDFIFRYSYLSGGIGDKINRHIKDFNNNEDLFIYEYIPTQGRDKGKLSSYLLYKGQCVSWLSTYVIVDDKKKLLNKTDYLTNILITDWWNGLTSEGNVSLKNGKKPESLLKLLLELTTNEGDIVLDAYFGTGTTGAVAMKMNRRFIGIEQLDEHYQKSLTRLTNVINGDTTGISKDVKWLGGGSFISCELANNSQNYIDRITNSTKEDELKKIYDELKDSDFVLYRVDIKEMDKQEDGFKNLSLEDKKKFLITIIDKNTLYINYSDINNEDYQISEEDKAFTENFYKRGDE